MARTRTRLVRVAATLGLVGLGLFAYDGLTQVASAAPPPVVNNDYAAYPPADAVPSNCTGGTGGPGVLQGYRAFIRRAGAPNLAPFVDPGPQGDYVTLRSMRRLQAQIRPGDEVVIRWTNWAPNCQGLAISFPLKATNAAFFDIRDDQALVRQPNGPFDFPFCYSSGPEACAAAGGGFELSTVIPQLNVVCGYQLDVVIGGPLETVGPHGSFYQTQNRVQANTLNLGTFNPNNPSMLIDAANGAMPCTPNQRIVIDKQWVGTGSQPPVNVPPGFVLTVTSSVSQTDLSVIGTATCSVANGALSCNYEDTGASGVPQGGLRVNADSLLTVTETGFPGDTADITFPVGMSSRFVSCQGISGPCQLTITNTPPPPPAPPETTTGPPTTIPTADTSIVPPAPPETLGITIPATLPATGSPDATPLVLFGLVLVPLGAVLVAFTRRRASAD